MEAIILQPNSHSRRLSSRVGTSLKYRPDIDGLRAIAVLSVVGFHSFPGWFKGGFVGVDVFFVISGFLISSLIFTNLEQGTFSYFEFYARRIRRIFPALGVVLAFCLGVGWLWLFPDEYARLGKHVAAGAGFIANVVLWRESGYFDTAAKLKPLLHLWSLGVEEQFYIVWPLLVALFWKGAHKTLLFMGAVLVLSFATSVRLTEVDPVAAFYLPVTRFWELSSGAVLAYVTLFPRRVPAYLHSVVWLRSFQNDVLREISAGTGLIFIVLSVFLLNKVDAFPGWRAMAPTAGAVLLIAVGQQSWIAKKVLAHPVAVFIGLISYPLYLWHWPLLAFVHLVEDYLTANQLRAAIIMADAISLVAAYLTYQFVEKPIRARGASWSAPGLCAAMASVLVLGLVVTFNHGFPGRFAGIGETNFAAIASASEYGKHLVASWRQGTCFLNPEQTAKDFAPDCIHDAASITDHGVLLWGDSHAAHLYRGIESAMGPSADLIQFTAAGCAPLIGVFYTERPHCMEITQYVLDWALQHRPNTVILAGDWPGQPHYRELETTVRKLKTAGVKRVIVIGPVAHFVRNVPDLLLAAIRIGPVPERIVSPLMNKLTDIDDTLRGISERAGAIFVSPLSLMCDAKGCIVALDGQITKIVAWDNAHLTTVGSEYVATKLLAPYLSPDGQIGDRR